MKLTKTKLKQMIREELKKEGIGDWLERWADKENEYRKQGADSLAQAKKEREERRKEKEKGKKKFFGSEFGKGLKDALSEEEGYRDAADNSMADTVPHS